MLEQSQGLKRSAVEVLSIDTKNPKFLFFLTFQSDPLHPRYILQPPGERWVLNWHVFLFGTGTSTGFYVNNVESKVYKHAVSDLAGQKEVQ